jgi:hypothetical protein
MLELRPTESPLHKTTFREGSEVTETQRVLADLAAIAPPFNKSGLARLETEGCGCGFDLDRPLGFTRVRRRSVLLDIRLTIGPSESSKLVGDHCHWECLDLTYMALGVYENQGEVGCVCV